jgi:hypothetical protein
MNFERGQEVKKALGIGIEEQIKSDIIGILPDIMRKYVHEFRTDELSEMIAYEIKEWTGHKVKIDWYGDTDGLLIIVEDTGLKNTIKIKASFEW